MELMQLENSDIVSFHSYRDMKGFASTVKCAPARSAHRPHKRPASRPRTATSKL